MENRGGGHVELEVHEGRVEDGPLSTGAVQGLKLGCSPHSATAPECEWQSLQEPLAEDRPPLRGTVVLCVSEEGSSGSSLLGARSASQLVVFISLISEMLSASLQLTLNPLFKDSQDGNGQTAPPMPNWSN